MKKYITKFSTTEEYESALAMLDFPNTSQVGVNIVFAPNEPEGKVRFINAGGVSVKSVACGADNTITSADSNGVRISGGSVEIGECATGLGTGAFATIQDAEIKGMPAEWLIDIPDSAFGLAYPEEGFDLSETQFIGNEAFRQNSHITGALSLPEVVSIGENAFYQCGFITSVVIGDNCTEIGDMAFYGSGLSSITLGSGLTRIGSDCFNYTSWYNSQSNNSILYIGNWAVGHKGYSITSVTVPSNITHLADSAFGNLSNLTSVTLPEGLISIGARAFVNCKPTELVIPSTVEYIGDQAVLYCESTLSDIIIKATTPPELGSDVFVYGNYPIYVPAESLADYKEAWPEVENRLFAIPTGTKATLTYLNGDTYDLSFDNGLSITQSEVGRGISDTSDPHYCTNIVDVTISNGVTSLGQYAFNQCSSLTSVTIPDSVTSIGNSAFNNCSSLTSATIGNGVTSIGNSAFNYCTKLTSVNIPDGVTSIGEKTFWVCTSLKSITIPDSVTSIGTQAFFMCGELENVVLGENVESIGNKAFASCEKLKTITLPETLNYLYQEAFSSCRSLTSVTIPDGVRYIYANTFSGCYSLSEITIPSSVITIAGTAFNGCYLTEENINNSSSASGYPWGITILDEETQDGLCIKDNSVIICRMEATSVTIPSTVTSIGNSAFSGCASLTSIVIPNSVTSIGQWVFNNCTGLTSIVIPDSVTSLGQSAFSSCTSLTSATIGNGVTSLGQSAFQNCTSLTSATIGNGVTSLGQSAFQNCISLSSATIGNGVTTIGAWAFDKCYSLTSVTIPDSVTSIDYETFSNCTGLTSMTIPSSVITIGDRAFVGCDFVDSNFINNSSATGYPWLATIYQNAVEQNGIIISTDGTTLYNARPYLTSVTIPNTVTSIVYDAFQDCTSLSSITCEPTTPPTLGGNVFGDTNDCPIYVPAASVETYKSTSGWSDYASRIQAIPNSN